MTAAGVNCTITWSIIMKKSKLPAALITNIGFIDEQHTTILQVADEIIDIIKSDPKKDRIEDLVDFLFKYAKEHFTVEEAYMLTNDYSDFEFHKEEHQYFNQYIENVKKDLAEKGDIKEITADVVESIKSWIIEHVHKTDLKMVNEIRSMQK